MLGRRVLRVGAGEVEAEEGGEDCLVDFGAAGEKGIGVGERLAGARVEPDFRPILAPTAW